jgi:hypothetical protein
VPARFVVTPYGRMAHANGSFIFSRSLPRSRIMPFVVTRFGSPACRFGLFVFDRGRRVVQQRGGLIAIRFGEAVAGRVAAGRVADVDRLCGRGIDAAGRIATCRRRRGVGRNGAGGRGRYVILGDGKAVIGDIGPGLLATALFDARRGVDDPHVGGAVLTPFGSDHPGEVRTMHRPRRLRSRSNNGVASLARSRPDGVASLGNVLHQHGFRRR